MSADSQDSTIQTRSGLRTEQRAGSSSTLGRMLQALKKKIFIEFDDVSWKQEDRGVGQAKLIEGLIEQEEADDWEKEEREVEGDDLVGKEMLGH